MTDDSSLGTRLSPPRRRSPIRGDHGRAAIEPLRRTTERVGLGSLARRLADVQGWLADDLIELETELRQVALPDRDRARKAARHLLERPGKRIRPICVLLGAQLAELPIDDAIRDVAVACELVHAATLLHDDVLDEGTERRGAPASRVVYSNSASILGGDFLLVEALQRVSATGRPALLDSLLATIAEMVAAEALQLEQRHRIEPSREAYLQVIEGKTASLFRWALVAPSTISGADPQQQEALRTAGEALGMAFQLVDDCLDLAGDSAETGKTLFADLLQGKLTWPLIIAVEHDPSLGDELRRLQAAGEVSAAEAAALIQRIRATDGLARTREFAEAQRIRAHEAVDLLPEGRARECVRAVVDAAVARHT